MHAVQVGAQNHTSSGFFPSRAEANANGLPVLTSVTFITGNGLAVLLALALAGVAVEAASATELVKRGASKARPIQATRTMRRVWGRWYGEDLILLLKCMRWCERGG